MKFSYEDYIQHNASNYKDEILVILSVTAIFAILIMADTFNVVTHYINEHKEYHLDKIILLHIPLFIMALWGSSLQFRRKKELTKSYYIDRLTNLPNRLAFKIAYEKRKNVYLVVLNIVDFKTVNQTLGLEEGDGLLKDATRILQELVKDHAGEQLYRLYGDEFAFFYQDKEDSLKSTLSHILNAFQESEIRTIDFEIKLDMHIAYSNIPSKFQTVMMAMEYAREASSEKIVEYKSFMNSTMQSKNNIRMLKTIKDAIYKDRVYPVFQGMVDNKSGKVFKYEALARMKNDEGQEILPMEFLDLAKRLKLYHHITKVMIEKSMKIFSSRSEELSINLSYSDISNKEVVEFLMQKLRQYPHVARRLTIEVIETESVHDYEILLVFYQNIKLYDCKLSIDDFGSGYANIINIFKLQPDFIKIDGSIIQNIFTNEKNRTFIKSIVSFAQSYDIKTVAEYVSSKELAQSMKELGIDISQGFYYDRPKELESNR
jgi:diguanylate cyclase (GGDEF)-like protein